MKKGECSLVTNHGIVLAFIANNPKPSTQEIAQETGLSIRGVSKIIIELRENGYLSWHREGRRNRYTVKSFIPLQQYKESDRTLIEVLRTILKVFDPLDRSKGNMTDLARVADGK